MLPTGAARQRQLDCKDDCRNVRGVSTARSVYLCSHREMGSDFTKGPPVCSVPECSAKGEVGR